MDTGVCALAQHRPQIEKILSSTLLLSVTVNVAVRYYVLDQKIKNFFAGIEYIRCNTVVLVLMVIPGSRNTLMSLIGVFLYKLDLDYCRYIIFVIGFLFHQL